MTQKESEVDLHKITKVTLLIHCIILQESNTQIQKVKCPILSAMFFLYLFVHGRIINGTEIIVTILLYILFYFQKIRTIELDGKTIKLQIVSNAYCNYRILEIRLKILNVM